VTRSPDVVLEAQEWLAGTGNTLYGSRHVRALVGECAALREAVAQHADRLVVEQRDHDETRGYRQKAEQERDAALAANTEAASRIVALERECESRVDCAYMHCDREECCARWTVARCDEHAVVKHLPEDPDVEPEPL